jgi:hypothetical protein
MRVAGDGPIRGGAGLAFQKSENYYCLKPPINALCGRSLSTVAGF